MGSLSPTGETVFSVRQSTLAVLSDLFFCPSQESFRGIEAVGAVLVLLSLFLATSQYDAPEEGVEDKAAGKAA